MVEPICPAEDRGGGGVVAFLSRRYTANQRWPPEPLVKAAEYCNPKGGWQPNSKGTAFSDPGSDSLKCNKSHILSRGGSHEEGATPVVDGEIDRGRALQKQGVSLRVSCSFRVNACIWTWFVRTSQKVGSGARI